ncbi:MAG: hypothetical protein IKP65_05085 [Alphaproteobacteria bacterium]|nr:hypothetical protein [Alphaproteobacteria bacterium]
MYEIGKDILPELNAKKAKETAKKEKISNKKEIILGSFIIGAIVAGLMIGSDKQSDIEIMKQAAIEIEQEGKNKLLQQELQAEAKQYRIQEEEDDRIAFYIQNSGIKMDGSITKPEFFKYFQYGYTDTVIRVKDGDKTKLKSYISRKIDPENKLKFEAEVLRMKENEKILQNQKQR